LLGTTRWLRLQDARSERGVVIDISFRNSTAWRLMHCIHPCRDHQPMKRSIATRENPRPLYNLAIYPSFYGMCHVEKKKKLEEFTTVGASQYMRLLSSSQPVFCHRRATFSYQSTILCHCRAVSSYQLTIPCHGRAAFSY
jgi:hypothetical protein